MWGGWGNEMNVGNGYMGLWYRDAGLPVRRIYVRQFAREHWLVDIRLLQTSASR